jgi:hypothetical protein
MKVALSQGTQDPQLHYHAREIMRRQ